MDDSPATSGSSATMSRETVDAPFSCISSQLDRVRHRLFHPALILYYTLLYEIQQDTSRAPP